MVTTRIHTIASKKWSREVEKVAVNLRANWQKDLARIEHDVGALILDRCVFLRVRDIANANVVLRQKAVVVYWMFDNYAAKLILGLRKQVDDDDRSVSLMNLLTQIHQSPWALSRDSYLRLCSTLDGVFAKDSNRHFDSEAGRGSFIDPALVAKDISDLKEAAHGTGIKQAADKLFAHNDRKGPARVPTYGELDACLDRIQALVRKYKLLLTGVVLLSFEPTNLDDFLDVFKQPWATS